MRRSLEEKALSCFKNELKAKCANNKKLNYDERLQRYLEKTEKQKARAAVKEEKAKRDEAAITALMIKRGTKKGIDYEQT